MVERVKSVGKVSVVEEQRAFDDGARDLVGERRPNLSSVRQGFKDEGALHPGNPQASGDRDPFLIPVRNDFVDRVDLDPHVSEVSQSPLRIP